MTVDIALAASARGWPDSLHRFVLDHGGARIVGRVMGPGQLLEDSYEVLFIDDVSSFLTPRLVTMAKRAGREVVGVYSPEDGSDAKRRLLECGISDVIECEATPQEFLRKAESCARLRVKPLAEAPLRRSGRVVGVIGVAGGVGTTEVALTLGSLMATRASTCLIDLDLGAPSVAQRLGLPLHPNLRTAIDGVLHGPNDIEVFTHGVGALNVVGGEVPNGLGSLVSHTEMSMLVAAIAEQVDLTVVDLGSWTGSGRALLADVDDLVLVGAGDPVGMTRLQRTKGLIHGLPKAVGLVIVVNRAPKRRFYRRELSAETRNVFEGVPLVTVPFDDRVVSAAWEGAAPRRGQMSRALRPIAELAARS